MNSQNVARLSCVPLSFVKLQRRIVISENGKCWNLRPQPHRSIWQTLSLAAAVKGLCSWHLSAGRTVAIATAVALATRWPLAGQLPEQSIAVLRRSNICLSKWRYSAMVFHRILLISGSVLSETDQSAILQRILFFNCLLGPLECAYVGRNISQQCEIFKGFLFISNLFTSMD